MKRDSFLDIVKLVFAIMIVLFHFGNGVLPGGRIAVEGFFMISGYFMMISIKNSKDEHIANSTVRYLYHKYLILARLLIPSVIVTVAAKVMFGGVSFKEVIHKIPLLLFEFIPLHALGYRGYYVVGISWYLSSMMFSLAILYPLVKKYGSSFVLTVGIPAVLFAYGFLSKVVGSMAVQTWITDPFIAPTGLIRGFAGCMAGCVLYEFVSRLKRYDLRMKDRAIILVIEVAGYLYIFYACKQRAKTAYDYVLVFGLFMLLLIGISGITGIKRMYSTAKTKILGTVSTLLVLNHYQWKDLKIVNNGIDGGKQLPQILLYFLAIIISCLLSYILSVIFIKIFHQWMRGVHK